MLSAHPMLVCMRLLFQHQASPAPLHLQLSTLSHLRHAKDVQWERVRSGVFLGKYHVRSFHTISHTIVLWTLAQPAALATSGRISPFMRCQHLRLVCMMLPLQRPPLPAQLQHQLLTLNHHRHANAVQLEPVRSGASPGRWRVTSFHMMNPTTALWTFAQPATRATIGRISPFMLCRHPRLVCVM